MYANMFRRPRAFSRRSKRTARRQSAPQFFTFVSQYPADEGRADHGVANGSPGACDEMPPPCCRALLPPPPPRTGNEGNGGNQWAFFLPLLAVCALASALATTCLRIC